MDSVPNTCKEVHGAQLAHEVGADVVFAKDVMVLGEAHEVVDMLAVALVLRDALADKQSLVTTMEQREMHPAYSMPTTGGFSFSKIPAVKMQHRQY